MYSLDENNCCQIGEKNISRHRTEDLWSLVLIELTSYCNFNCSFCPSGSMTRKKSIMPRKLWEKVLYELSGKKMTHKVQFHLLGEPLLHKDVFHAIHLANSLGLFVSLYTNGLLLKGDIVGNLLNSLKKGLVVLSMQDISPESFAKRCRGTISWEKYIERLQNFIRLVEKQEYSPFVQIHCMADIRGMGWDLLQILHIQKRIQAVYDQWRKVLGLKKKIKINVFNPTISYPLGKYCSFFVKLAGNWDNQLISNDVEVVPRYTGHCVYVNDTFAILSDGTCTYCCNDFEGNLNVGNAHEKSLESIYYGERATKIREAESYGKFIEERCRECQGKLVFKGSRKPVPSRNILTDYYIFWEHLRYFGIKSASRKAFENIRKRFSD